MTDEDTLEVPRGDAGEGNRCPGGANHDAPCDHRAGQPKRGQTDCEDDETGVGVSNDVQSLADVDAAQQEEETDGGANQAEDGGAQDRAYLSHGVLIIHGYRFRSTSKLRFSGLDARLSPPNAASRPIFAAS